jgi:hypothetical protein
VQNKVEPSYVANHFQVQTYRSWSKTTNILSLIGATTVEVINTNSDSYQCENKLPVENFIS